jgi:O-antigen/teichoic acid export membrane protein
VLNLILTVLTADQRPTIGSAVSMLGSVLFIFVIILLKHTTSGSLIYLSIASGISTLLVLFLASLYFYHNKYRAIHPSVSAVDFKHFHELANLGIQFFIIQAVSIILFTTDNIIITQLQGPEDVTPYALSRKYMEIVPMGLSMILLPLWSAYTEAYVKKDFPWIRRTVRVLLKIWMASIILILLQIVPAKTFFHLWIGDKIEISITLLLLMGMYHILFMWSNIFVFFINGVGKIRLQLYSGIIEGLINIPISIYFAKYLGMGSAGVILGTCVCLGIGCIWAPIQYHKIMNGTATGIWAK